MASKKEIFWLNFVDFIFLSGVNGIMYPSNWWILDFLLTIFASAFSEINIGL